jgi:hypothetical protein
MWDNASRWCGGCAVTAKIDDQDFDRLYRQYVEPLENDHAGEYAGVSLDGRTVLRSTLLDAVQESVAQFGKGKSVVFRVGDKVVGRVR